MTSQRSFRTANVKQPAWLVPARVERPELLDLGLGTPTDVATNLAEMWRANRYLGGLGALTRHLYPRLMACTEPVITVADVGLGSAELPPRVLGWSRRRALRPVIPMLAP